MVMNKKSINSICVGELRHEPTTQPHQLPLYATSSFAMKTVEEGIDIFTGKKDGHVYSRYGNPTVDIVAQKIAMLEGYDLENVPYAYMTSSGMSAISSMGLACLESGDQILTQGNLYGGTTELFNKIFGSMGVETIFTDLNDLENVEQLLKDNPRIKLLYFETPANPTLACVDLKEITDLARAYNKVTAIDNTFPTPYLQRPFNFGIDFVIHSTTKFLNGHGNSISGIVLGQNEKYQKKLWEVIKLAGTNGNPWDSWLLNNGLKTLSVRMDRHCDNAMKLAQFLEAHEGVNYVNYIGLESHPHHAIAQRQMSGFGGMLSFDIKGDDSEAMQFMNRLKLATMAPTLGDVDTLVLHPATSSHLNVDKDLREENGITDTLIRISVGIEDVKDIIEDVRQALG